MLKCGRCMSYYCMAHSFRASRLLVYKYIAHCVYTKEAIMRNSIYDEGLRNSRALLSGLITLYHLDVISFPPLCFFFFLLLFYAHESLQTISPVDIHLMRLSYIHQNEKYKILDSFLDLGIHLVSLRWLHLADVKLRTCTSIKSDSI